MAIKRYKVVRSPRDRTSAMIVEPKYKIEYPVGEVVHAIPGSMGIFCFETEIEAKIFAKLGKKHVIEVLPIGKGCRPWIRARDPFRTSGLKSFYRAVEKFKVNFCLNRKGLPRKKDMNKYSGDIANKRETISMFSLPKGTICYPAVKVLT